MDIPFVLLGKNPDSLMIFAEGFCTERYKKNKIKSTDYHVIRLSIRSRIDENLRCNIKKNESQHIFSYYVKLE